LPPPPSHLGCLVLLRQRCQPPVAFIEGQEGHALAHHLSQEQAGGAKSSSSSNNSSRVTLSKGS
jgi:hypothetical protein